MRAPGDAPGQMALEIAMDKRGVVTVSTDMTDIGTGSYTIIAQTVAETMGVDLDRVVVRLGDPDFPASAGSGGQFGANNSTAGVYAACMKLREMIAHTLGFNVDDAQFAGGNVHVGGQSVPLAVAAGESGLSAEDSIEYCDLDQRFRQSTFYNATGIRVRYYPITLDKIIHQLPEL